MKFLCCELQIASCRKNLSESARPDRVCYGGAKLPDGKSSGFGTSYYTSGNFQENKPHLYIKASVVFGGIEINK